MRKNNFILTVLRKELVDMLRDRRTMITGILLPVLLYPIIFYILGNMIGGMQKEVEENTTVAVSTQFSGDYAALPDILSGVDGVTVTMSDDPAALLEDGSVKVALLPGDPFTVLYDETKMDSSNSMSYVTSIIGDANNAIVAQTLAEMGIDLDELSPFKYQTDSLSAYIEATTGEQRSSGSGGMMMGMMIPMMLGIVLATGGMAAAIDLFAGEKERKTFEPLLTTRAGRLPILMGKYLAVSVFGMMTAIMMSVGMGIGFAISPGMFTVETGEISLQLAPGVIALSVVLVMLMALIFSGIHVAISTWSRTIKEASSYSSFVMLAAMLPSYATMYMQAGDIKPWMMAVPVLNVIGALKMVLGGVVRYELILLAIAASAAFLALVLAFTLRLFRKEHIMFRM